ncbi:hypothetical protein C0J52_17071 [Blattella germanica]|nr:hypothetical protein C0J52_17071 [Blattella germanica]
MPTIIVAIILSSLATTSVMVGGYTLESQDKWIRHLHALRDGTFSTNDVAEELKENIERFSASDNIYKGLAGSLSETWNSCPDDEDPRNASISCHGVKILKRVMDQLLDTPRNFELAGGVQLVRVSSTSNNDQESEAMSRSMQKEGNMLTRIYKFLRSYEMRIKISDLLPTGEDLTSFVQKLRSENNDGSARKKDKGQGMLLAMGLMMKGMLTAIGMGGLGLLAMKALMVSAMALLLSAIIGIKKLASKDDDHGGHHVSVVPVHHSGGDHGHYRKKRSLDDGDIYEAALLAYRGYQQLFATS